MTPEEKVLDWMWRGNAINHSRAMTMGVPNIKKVIAKLRESYSIQDRRSKQGPSWYMGARQ